MLYRHSVTLLTFIRPLPHRAFLSSLSTSSNIKMSLRTPQDINNMWFDADRSKFNDPAFLKALMGKWFGRSVPEVEETFIAESHQIDYLAETKDLDEQWFTPEGYLARIVMFDQGSRTAFRGTAKAFAFDAAAAALAAEIITDKKWFFSKYLPIERQAIMTSLLHAEDLSYHNLAAEYLPRICEDITDAGTVACFAGLGHFFKDHRAVVEQFGRFPSRNAALGRENTPEEEAWLSSPDLPMWAKSQAVVKKD